MHQARERIKKDQIKGKYVRETLREAKRITSGIVVKAGTRKKGKKQKN